MKMIETLNNQQKVDMLNGNFVGIFPTMILFTDSYYDTVSNICFGYYIERSGCKTISPSYERLIEMVKTAEGLNETAEQLIGKYIRGKYYTKWNRIYDALLARNYNPLTDYEHHETKDSTHTDDTTYDTTVVDDGSTSTDETTTRSVETGDDVYGFNSQNTVGESKSTDESVETVHADAEYNKTHNIQSKTGRDLNTAKYKDFIDESGRHDTAAKLINEELDLRDKQIFYDIIYRDIDSIATLQIYI